MQMVAVFVQVFVFGQLYFQTSSMKFGPEYEILVSQFQDWGKSTMETLVSCVFC